MRVSMMRNSGRTRTGRSTSPWGILIGGIVILAVGYYFYTQQKAFMETAQETTGVVESISRRTQSRYRDGIRYEEFEYYPIIAFSIDGKSYTFNGSGSQHRSRYQEGQVVEVLYDPANPNSAQIKKSQPMMTSCIFLGLGLTGSIVGVVMLIKRKKGSA